MPHLHRRAPSDVRREHVDSLTELLAVDGPLTWTCLRHLRHELADVLQDGAAFVVLDLRRALPGDHGLDDVLEPALSTLEHREGGLAVVGGRRWFPVLPDGVDAFADLAEAVAGVRGRLTPGRAVHVRCAG